MPELSLTDDQHTRLEEIRQDVEEAFVGPYGRASLEDAFEYLLDTYTPPDERDERAADYEAIVTAEYPELQRIASDVPDVSGSGIDADTMRGKLLVELGPEELAARLETGPDETDDSAADGEADADESTDPDGGDGIGSNGLLSAANQLLDEHDEKWRESDGDTPYEVDLPDGSTESARTKDDVRQLLFRHY